MRADVVEPDGLNANWSPKELEYSGLRSIGYKNDLTSSFSINLDSIGVMEIGRQCWHVNGCVIFRSA